MNTGTLNIEDLLRQEAITLFGYAEQVGMENIVAALNAELEAHNTIMREMIESLAMFTEMREGTYGGGGAGEMVEVDQYGRAPTQKTVGASPVGWPLRKFQFNIGWTNNYLRQATPADVARQQVNAQDKHRSRFIKEVKRALFPSANYTWTDFLIDNRDIAVKRLVNADSQTIPTGPNGETYDGATHTHYDAIDWGAASAAARNTAIIDLINDVREHNTEGTPVLVIAQGDEANISALTDFLPVTPVNVIPGTQSDYAAGDLDTTNSGNRMIGILKTSGAEVWVKPWGVLNYPMAFIMDAPEDDRPLAVRERTGRPSLGLARVSLIEIYPLVADVMESEFGIGVSNRTSAAILYTGGAAYTDPTF